jgi:hypothetical protein
MGNKVSLQNKNQVYEVTVEGSLGLLAYGDIGLRAWRKVKQSHKQHNDKNETK